MATPYVVDSPLIAAEPLCRINDLLAFAQTKGQGERTRLLKAILMSYRTELVEVGEMLLLLAEMGRLIEDEREAASATFAKKRKPQPPLSLAA